MLSKLESRKECMEQIELIQHWNYFCSLAERLDDTKHYIDHGLQEHDGIRELVHGKVYSDIFKQIIVLAASEFEIMSKEDYLSKNLSHHYYLFLVFRQSSHVFFLPHQQDTTLF